MIFTFYLIRCLSSILFYSVLSCSIFPTTIGILQTSRWGLEVDEKLCVRGVTAENIFALGDCAVTGCAPTAQSASQQGKYLGRLFRDTKLEMRAVRDYPDFKFINKGSLAYLGDGKGFLMLSYLLLFYLLWYAVERLDLGTSHISKQVTLIVIFYNSACY